MKKVVKVLTVVLGAMSLAVLTGCGAGGSSSKSEANGLDTLVSKYGYQWTDTKAPILNEQGAKDISFRIYSSKNASAKDYNDMKIMQDLFEQTNVNVSWENVSESIYSQQKNLIIGNKDKHPDAIFHAGMSASSMQRER